MSQPLVHLYGVVDEKMCVDLIRSMKPKAYDANCSIAGVLD